MSSSSSSTKRPAVVFVDELEDGPAARFLGRFSARLERAARLEGAPRRTVERAEELSVDEAIAWGRERAGFVLVRFGRRDELWSAGATSHWSYPRWPPPDAPPLIPRPVPPEDWERAGVDSELMWAVTIRLAPKEVFVAGAVNDDRDSWDVTVASAAAAARLDWDRQLLDGFLDDAERERGETSFSSFWSPAYRVYGVVAALDPEDAKRAVAAPFVAPDGFVIDYRVRPADLTERLRRPA